MTPRRSVTVLTHQRPVQTGSVLDTLVQVAREAGVLLRFDPDETRKHHLAAQDVVAVDAPLIDDVELCIVLGGDGTILRALRRYAGTSVPVFAVNFGEVGFLATVDPDDDGGAEAFRQALRGDFETLTLPAIALELPGGPQAAINDISIHRKVGERVATLAYASNGEEVGSVRCDGLVVATPAGSTGYNLANGGPVMAWGVEGFAVSFIAPHSLTARALVVAPDDELTIFNRSLGAVDLSVDGRPVGELGPGQRITARFVREAADLAQLPGTSFYRRLREKFGRLSS
ncbi:MULTISPECIES: NAD(+)/NADH kinase [Solirubrobacterales]|uniref:NAD kinase n=1 Tax=Paraconexibacter algicola TaxID=2133960 RepID=A0A2T4UC12_9ACTN|nr:MULTISPECIES: NAD(+)/NADH kinase [Solirubrobacterales]PTL54778.1 ATP-NAD kinase [Paraconexibacter algicola]